MFNSALTEILIITGVIFTALIFIGIIIARLYTRSSKEVSFVRTGFGGEKVIATNITLPDGTYELMAKVRAKDGSEKDTRVKIGVKMDWNASPSPSPSPSISPSPTP